MLMKSLYVTLSLVFFTTVLIAQNEPNLQWQKTFGGGGIDQAKSIVPCTDGGYIVAGHSTSANGDVVGAQPGYNFWAVKMDANGIMEWQKPLGGSGADWGTCIRQSPDGGYIFCGYTTSNNGDVSGNHGDFDYWVVKLDDSGALEWQKAYGGLAIDQAKHIEPCMDGGYILCGTSFSEDGNVSGNHGANDFWLVKIDSVGTLEWQKSLGGSGSEMANCVKQTDDGGFIVAGYSSSANFDVDANYGGFDFWVVKTDALGSIQWEHNYGGSADEQAFSIDVADDGGFIVVGNTYSSDGDVTANHGAADYWVIKIADNGDLEWEKSFGGASVDQAYAVCQTSDGDFVVAGFGTSNSGDISDNHGNNDYWILKLSPIGNVRWKRSYGGSGVDQAYAVRQTADLGLIITGYTISSDGDLTDSNINGDYWVIKLGGAVTGINEVEASKVSIFPNPVVDVVHVQSPGMLKSICVYDTWGRLLQRECKPVFSVGALAAGIYTLQVETQEGTQALRIIKR